MRARAARVQEALAEVERAQAARHPREETLRAREAAANRREVELRAQVCGMARLMMLA